MKQNKNVKIAVTGGIGSGKSTVCRLIAGNGFPVYSCDEVYSELIDGNKLKNKLVEEFGAEILSSGGKVDRRALSKIVFSNAEKLKKLNTITHGAVFEEIFARANKDALAFFEVPVLFEGNYQGMFDEVIVVKRQLSSRIFSVMNRDKLSEEQVSERVNRQYNYDNSDFAQYYVIHNDGNFDDLKISVNDLMLKIVKKYEQ